LEADAIAGATALLDAYRRHTGDRDMNSKRLAAMLQERGFTNGRGAKGRIFRRGLAVKDQNAGVELVKRSPVSAL
jgi:hypothetical protein